MFFYLVVAEGEDEAAIESALAELTTQHQARKQVSGATFRRPCWKVTNTEIRMIT